MLVWRILILTSSSSFWYNLLFLSGVCNTEALDQSLSWSLYMQHGLLTKDLVLPFQKYISELYFCIIFFIFLMLGGFAYLPQLSFSLIISTPFQWLSHAFPPCHSFDYHFRLFCIFFPFGSNLISYFCCQLFLALQSLKIPFHCTPIRMASIKKKKKKVLVRTCKIWNPSVLLVEM